ncbi:MAG: murein L,D-transpeptidase catalytic domain family protein, partial [Bacteroidales bacterium]
EYASHFSNTPSSYQSSLGFYITGDTYIGKHGISLILDGVEPGINDKARERSIVMHGADYVSKSFIREYGRLGRSFGCPSIPLEDHERIINLLSGMSCIYIYYPDESYLASTHLFATEPALKGINSFLNEWSAMFNTFPQASSVSDNQ